MTTEPRTHTRVVVIGGGVIGLSSAYHLARAGHEVVLLERGPSCGHAASWGNAGWIVPALVHPFNAPGAAPQAVRSMLTDRESAIAIRQLPNRDLIRWGLSFLRASRPPRSHKSMDALSTFASRAADQITGLADELRFELHRTGLLVPFRSLAALEAYQRAHEEIEAGGYRGRVEILDSQGAREREPALSDGVVGALHLLDELSVRPDSMNTALADGLIAAGGKIVLNAEVTEIASPRDGLWECRTQDDQYVAESVVVAAGENTDSILRPRGVRIALQSGRGCSVTLPAGTIELRQPLKIAEHRVACTPFEGGEVRISGTFDLVKPGAPTERRRMLSVLRAATSHLPGLKDLDLSGHHVWSGARPTTPDSIPLVGPVGSVPGLFVASGHGTLGMTLAVETGQRITDLVNTARARI